MDGPTPSVATRTITLQAAELGGCALAIPRTAREQGIVFTEIVPEEGRWRVAACPSVFA